MPRVTYKTLWHKFRDESVVNRCEQYAKYTVPYLMADIAEVSASGRVMVERDFQEIGALLLNSLSAKLARLLFPTQFPFFNASASDVFKKAARRQGYTDEKLRQGFAQLEMAANKRLFLNAGYAALILALKHLIVTGQVLLHRNSKTGTITAYGLQSFTTRRDGDGELMDCVLREYTTVEALPENIQVALRTSSASKYSRPEQSVEKYTRIHREYRNGACGYSVSQEVDTIIVGEPSWYPKNLCPWMCPTWTLIPGEHYARGMVEDYAGGFARLSSLSESSALYAVEIMRVVHLVGSGSGGDVDDLTNAESGEYVRGDPKQIQAHEAGDAQKLAELRSEIEATVMRLSRAFMYQGGTRDAERVTAYELARDAQEAEHALGGAYSTLSSGIQVPLAHVLMTEVSDDALTGLITGELQPDVTAGIPALGRAADVQNFLMAAQEIGAVLPVVQLDKRINPQRVIDMIFAGRSVDTSTIYYTPAEQKKLAEADQNLSNGIQGMAQAGTMADQSQQLTQIIGAS